MRRLCADLLHALFSREESPGGLLRWGRMARSWPGIKAGRGKTYLSDAGMNYLPDTGALYTLQLPSQVSRRRRPRCLL